MKKHYMSFDRKRHPLLKYIISIVLLLSFINPVSVFAGNDGQPRSDPIGQSGASKSFGGDAKYYDFLIPYKMSLKDIGGYGVKEWKQNRTTGEWRSVDPGASESELSTKCYNFNLEGRIWDVQGIGYSESNPKWRIGGRGGVLLDVPLEADTGFEYVEVGGCKFYIAAVGKALFNNSCVASGEFLPWASFMVTGVIYDVILKDGTVIHFVTGDGMGEAHTNNPTGAYPEGALGEKYEFAHLSYPQYSNLFYASAPHQTLECFCTRKQVNGTGALNAFQRKYNIGESNPIVAIRLWNKSLKGILLNGQTLEVNPGCGGLYFKGVAIPEEPGDSPAPVGPVTPGGNPVTPVIPGDDPQYQPGTYVNIDVAIYQALTEANLEEELLQGATDSNLHQTDLEGLTEWGRNRDSNLKEHGWIAVLRWITSFIGIVLTLWALFVYIAFWFDHINTFFYIDLLHILTFGKLHICPPNAKPTFSVKDNNKKDKTVSHPQIIAICLTALLFGALLISGVFYKVVAAFVRLIFRIIGM